MSDPHDHQPDPAALDELQRAFDDPPTDPDEASADRSAQTDAESRRHEVLSALGIDDDIEDLAAEHDVGEPEEILIVEQDPLVDPTPTPATPPTVIRIDDYGGSVVVDAPPPEEAAESAQGAAPAPAGSTDGGGGEADDVGEPSVIAIADHEDLPDAVYVEGDLEGSGSRNIVFIDDDDTGDAIAPEIDREVRRGIEPRLRERRAAVKRALGRKRLRWLLFGTLIVLVAVGVLAVLGSGLFAIKAENVTVIGVRYADPDRVDAVVDDLVGTPSLLADTQAAEEQLEAIPWVDEARVRVSFPNTATIEIRERAAMTTYQGPDQRYRVLDRDGRVLAVLDGYPIAYVLLSGPDPVDLEPGQFAPQGYAAASELAKNLTTSIRGQVALIEVTSDGTRLTMYLDDGTEVRFGAARDLFNKLLRLETALANKPDREPGVIDVSTSEVTL